MASTLGVDRPVVGVEVGSSLVLLVKPGGVSKLLGIALGAAAVTTFVRKDRSSATIVAVVLLAIAAFFLVALVTGNSHWFTDRYAR